MGMKITKTNEKRIGLNIILKHQKKNPKQEYKVWNQKHKMSKIKIQKNKIVL
jgi:hypothetical protein